MERSPIHHIHRLQRPVIFYHGDEDKVVPPNQSQLMFDKLTQAGLPSAMVMYKGEGHGFKQDASIRHTVESELFFYGRVLGFRVQMPGDLDAVQIVNLPPC
mmetsp:Transcript_12143/g.34157  ORF Transcript_12143/g.34157 Transcript_12143/m.34157 type:complete len:101 (-) Transcript_12143:369-671(-)